MFLSSGMTTIFLYTTTMKNTTTFTKAETDYVKALLEKQWASLVSEGHKYAADKVFELKEKLLDYLNQN